MNYYTIQSIRALFISIGDAQKATILRNERIWEILINFYLINWFQEALNTKDLYKFK